VAVQSSVDLFRSCMVVVPSRSRCRRLAAGFLSVRSWSHGANPSSCFGSLVCTVLSVTRAVCLPQLLRRRPLCSLHRQIMPPAAQYVYSLCAVQSYGEPPHQSIRLTFEFPPRCRRVNCFLTMLWAHRVLTVRNTCHRRVLASHSLADRPSARPRPRMRHVLLRSQPQRHRPECVQLRVGECEFLVAAGLCVILERTDGKFR